MKMPRLIWESQFCWGEGGCPSKNKKSSRAFKLVKGEAHLGVPVLMGEVWVSFLRTKEPASVQVSKW
jgi:hypothetical protein